MNMLQNTLNRIGQLDKKATALARARLDSLTKPLGSLGALEDLAVKLAGITGNPMPEIGAKVVVVMAGDHGVVAEGVSAYPQEVTPQMVHNFLRGRAAINVLARHAGARVVVVDMGVVSEITHLDLVSVRVKHGTDNMAEGPCMSRDEAVRAIEEGIRIANREIERGASLLATGDMGIGNTTASSAILAAINGLPVPKLVGRGTGVDDKRLSFKIDAIERALVVNRPDPSDPIDVLAKVGGLEIGGLAGCILAASANRIPVVIDGFISGAAALIAGRIEPKAIGYMIASHLSEEPGHRIMLDMMGLEPLLRMRMRLGEGTGAVLAFHLIEAASRIIREMATFDEARVAGALD